jgi:hypothetical protein
MVRGTGSRAQTAPGFIAQAVPIRSTEEPSAQAVVPARATPHLVRVPEAARITGLPWSLLRKSFMTEDKRPKNVPSPPPQANRSRGLHSCK